MAPPLKSIDEVLVIELASKGYTVEYIAAMVQVSDDTLRNRCSGSLKKGWALRNGSLQAKQVELATAGNPTMCIWLGKQWLGQKDKVEHTDERSPKGYGNLPVGNKRTDLGKTDRPN